MTNKTIHLFFAEGCQKVASGGGVDGENVTNPVISSRSPKKPPPPVSLGLLSITQSKLKSMVLPALRELIQAAVLLVASMRIFSSLPPKATKGPKRDLDDRTVEGGGNQTPKSGDT